MHICRIALEDVDETRLIRKHHEKNVWVFLRFGCFYVSYRSLGLENMSGVY